MWPILFPLTFRLSSVSGGDLNAIIYMCFYVGFAIIFAAVLGAYVMPVLGTFIIGPEGISLRRGAPVRAIPSRLVPPAPS